MGKNNENLSWELNENHIQKIFFDLRLPGGFLLNKFQKNKQGLTKNVQPGTFKNDQNMLY